MGSAAIITLIAGIYNFEFWGGPSEVTAVHILLSIASYSLWVFYISLLVWRGHNPLETSKKTSVALLVCLLIGILMDQSPLTILVISPLMGIGRIAIGYIEPMLLISILYLAVLALVWIDLIIKRKR